MRQCTIVSCIGLVLASLTIVACDHFTLTILHVNDFYSRFEQMDMYGGNCSEADAQNNNCYGGIARLKTAVDEVRAKHPDSILVGAGNFLTGTVWHSILKWRPMAHFLNRIHFDALSLGQHEFDGGLEELARFQEALHAPLLAANIDSDKVSEIDIAPYTIVEKSGKRIGIIGYVTSETQFYSNTGDLHFGNLIRKIHNTARHLERKGVKIIIAVGNAGFEKDLEIAKKCIGVDVVVGGRSRKFLYNGEKPSIQEVDGSYPVLVRQKHGPSFKNVAVVQAYALGRYLGKMDVIFDNTGLPIMWNGNPILLNGTYDQDKSILREIEEHRERLYEGLNEEIGQTNVHLDGHCQLTECNLGNMMTDAFVDNYVKFKNANSWGGASLAVTNGDGLTSSIEKGPITVDALRKAAPFQDPIDIVDMKGRHVKEMFEYSISKYDGVNKRGEFLQVSGFRVTYNVTKAPGNRVTKLEALCVNCNIPVYKKVVNDATYKIIMPEYIIEAGAGFNVIKENIFNQQLIGILDTDIYEEYVRKMTPIRTAVEGRITIVT